MDTSTILGGLIVASGGLCMGTGAWTLKAQRQFKIEHWLFVAMLTGLVIIPWSVTLLAFPNALSVYGAVGWKTLLLANLFAFGWGIANVLCGLCFVRIGVALTGGILGGLGLSLGVIIPMVFKASGLFEEAADLNSPAGLTVLLGVVVMLGGVALVSVAGFGRDRALASQQRTSGSFFGGFVMVVIAGVLSTGPNFVFAYSQDPIVSRVTVVHPSTQVSVRIGGNAHTARQLSRTYTVDANGAIAMAEPVGAVPTAGLSPQQAAAGIESVLQAKRLFLKPKVKIVARGDATLQTNQTIQVKLAETAPGKSYPVGADGQLTLESGGVVNAGGRSAIEVRRFITEAVRTKGMLVDPAVSVDTHNLLAPFPVWAVGMLAGALVNLLFPLYLMRRNQSGSILKAYWKELPFPVIGGVQFFVAILLLGIGSLQLGALGASVGWGISQAMQILGGQAVGFLSGEWRGVRGKPRTQMYLAILILVLAALVVAYGNTRPKI
jgi:protein involved in polysaccharide export with SLBB domain